MDEVQATHTHTRARAHSHMKTHVYTQHTNIQTQTRDVHTQKHTHTLFVWVENDSSLFGRERRGRTHPSFPGEWRDKWGRKKEMKKKKTDTKKEMFTVKENEVIERENFRSGREERRVRSKENSRKGYVGVKWQCVCVCVCVSERESVCSGSVFPCFN